MSVLRAVACFVVGYALGVRRGYWAGWHHREREFHP